MGSDGATNREALLRAGAWLAGSSGRSAGLFPKARSIATLQVAKARLGDRRGSLQVSQARQSAPQIWFLRTRANAAPSCLGSTSQHFSSGKRETRDWVPGHKQLAGEPPHFRALYF